MKKIVIILMICMSLPSAATTYGHKPARTVEEVSDGIIVTYTFDNPEIVDSEYYEDTKYIRYEGFGLSDGEGEPCIPFRNDTFLVPNDCNITVSVLDSAYVDTTFVLSPSLPIFPDEDIGIQKHSIAFYTGFYPSNAIQSHGVYQNRNDALITVSISPVKYNYQTNTVRRYTFIRYKLTYSGDNYEYKGSKTSFAKRIIQNKMSGRSDVDVTEKDERHYLIITTTEYESSLNDFVEWKKQKGFNVYLATRPKGTWTTDSVKRYIQDHFEQDSIKNDYLLIVGGVEDVPADTFGYSYKSGNDSIFTTAVTDFNYCLPDADSIPQIFHGRIPADSPLEVSTILNKIIQYEKNPPNDDSFYHSGLNCSVFQDNNNDGYEDVCYLMTSENIREHVLSQGYQIYRQYVKKSSSTSLKWSTLYGNGEALPIELTSSNFSWSGGFTGIMSHINNGMLYVFHRDHGAVSMWSSPLFLSPQIKMLQNGNKQPVVFSINCSTGKYNRSTDCFSEVFLKKADGGCVGIYAPTELSFSGYNDAMALGMFDAIWPGLQPQYPLYCYSGYSPTPTPTYELGQILDQGLKRMAETYVNYRESDGVFWVNITKKLFHCFGDPSMQIYTDKPRKFSEPLVYSRGDSIFVSVEDGNCKITFYDKTTEDVKSYYGCHAAYANPSDSIIICLDRHNYIPFIWDYTKDVYIQNEYIQGEIRDYRGNTIYVGNNVTATKPEGEVNIQNSHITINGKRLELHAGTRIDKNFKFQDR